MRDEAVPATWLFIPHANTLYCEHDTTVASQTVPKLKYYATGELRDEYRGAGRIVDEERGRIVGCYKVHADTADGQDTKTDVIGTKWDAKFNASDRAAIFRTPASKRTKEQNSQLADLIKEMQGWPTKMRRLNGLLLDGRPQLIALHNPEVLHLHPSMEGVQLDTFCDKYKDLEHRTRRLMGNAFGEKRDLPLYRLKEDELAREMGVELPDFSEED